MEFRIAKAEFLRGLRLAQGIADRKSTMPMLANVLLRTQGKNQLLVAATDLNVSLTAELKSHNATDGGITLGAKNLYELVANAPGDEITLKKADNHWAEIKSGKVTYRIVGMPDRDFPKVPDHREATLRDRRERGAARDDRAHAVLGLQRRDPVSPQRRVLRERRLEGRMVSTDGHRLSKVERTIANGPKLSAGVIIPEEGPARDQEGPRAGAERQARGQDAARVPGPGRHRDRGQADRRAVPALRAGDPAATTRRSSRSTGCG